MDFVNQQYWDESYRALTLDFNNDEDPIVKLLKAIIVAKKKGDVFEIGCYPGRYLKIFGEQGYKLNGIDTTPGVKEDLVDYFKKKNFRIGEFIHGDVFDIKSVKQYDIVCSFGFIEHFTYWEKVIAIHMSLVKQGGIVIITVPNFSGFIQNIFHRIFDKINLSRHNIKAMNVEAWKRSIEMLSLDYKIIFEGPIGKIDLWADMEKRSKLKSYLLNKVFKSVSIFQKWKIPSSKHYSPYLGLIIQVK